MKTNLKRNLDKLKKEFLVYCAKNNTIESCEIQLDNAKLILIENGEVMVENEHVLNLN